MADQNPVSAPTPEGPAPTDAPAAPPAPVAASAPVPPDARHPSSEEAQHHHRSRLLEQARVESDSAARLVQSRHDFARRGELLIKAVPDKYLELAAAIRAAVRMYNDALEQQPENPIPVIHWFESPNVILREPLLGDGMRIRLSRLQNSFELVLRFVNRNSKPDVPLIEGYGSFGRDAAKTKVFMRIEGWVEKGEVIYWYNLDFKRQTTPLTEVPERIVLAVASGNFTHLSRDYTPDEEQEGEQESSVPSRGSA
jgi:hypothetical protein